MKVTAENIRKFEKNTLQCVFDLNLEGLMTIFGCTAHRKNESWWIGLPAKSYLDKDGATKWQPVIEMPSERLASLRDLVMDDIRKALESPQEAPGGTKEASKPVEKHRQWHKTERPPKTPVSDSGWAIPDSAGDLSGIGSLDDSDIPF